MRINTTHSLFWILLMFSFLFALSVLLLTYSLSFSIDFLFSCASVLSFSRSFLTDAGLSLSLTLSFSSSFCVRARVWVVHLYVDENKTNVCLPLNSDRLLSAMMMKSVHWRYLAKVTIRRRTGFSFHQHCVLSLMNQEWHFSFLVSSRTFENSQASSRRVASCDICMSIAIVRSTLIRIRIHRKHGRQFSTVISQQSIPMDSEKYRRTFCTDHHRWTNSSDDWRGTLFSYRMKDRRRCSFCF